MLLVNWVLLHHVVPPMFELLFFLSVDVFQQKLPRGFFAIAPLDFPRLVNVGCWISQHFFEWNGLAVMTLRMVR